MQNIQFTTTSQYCKWMYTPEQLVNVLSEKEKTYSKLKIPITCQDELKIQAYYLNLLSKIVKQTQLPRTVQGTAFTYFRRFYMKKSLYSSSPQQIAYICLYLGCKVEEINDQVIVQLSQKIQMDLKQHALVHYGHIKYRDMEWQVLKILDFDLETMNVYQIVEDVIRSLDQNKFGKGQDQDQIVQQLNELAKISFYQNLIFQYSHGIIGQAILKIVEMQNEMFTFAGHVQDQFINFYENIQYENNYTQQVINLLLQQIDNFKFDYQLNVKNKMALIKEAQKQQQMNQHKQKEAQERLQQIKQININSNFDNQNKKIKMQ